MSELGSATLRLPSREEMRQVAAAWAAFTAGQAQGLEKVRSVIRESWQRAQRFGVDPFLRTIPVVLPAEELAKEQERVDLMGAAKPLFAMLTQAGEPQELLLWLTDRHGYVIHLDGHPCALQRATEVGVVPGSGMAEEFVGTVAANVVLAHGATNYVVWNEHYCQAFHSWAVLGAPIRHPVTREIMGVVGAGAYELLPSRSLYLIEQVASCLEQLLYNEELTRRVTLLDAYHRFILRHPHDTVLALDGRGHVCGASSSVASLLEAPHQILGQSLLQVRGLHVEGLRHLSRHEALQPYTLRVTALPRGISLRATAIPVHGERQPVGTLVVLQLPQRPRQKTSGGWRATYTFADLIGEHPSFQACLALARQAAQGDFPVLLLGESGTGKELLAQAIHSASPRWQGPFVAVNCGAATDELLAAELFGYEEGAFTGAVKGGRKGKLELADGGTLLLDEVDAMSAKMQVSLLRVLEEGKMTRVGAESPLAVDVRVIAASNADLQAAIRHKGFRLDLYHRLAAFPIVMPPLRQRREDLPLLARHLLTQLGFPHLHLSAEALALLQRYTWPGNVRELKNILLRAAQFATGTVITPAVLPPELTTAAPSARPASCRSLRETERELILRTLAETGNDVSLAAARLGIHRTTLYRKLKRYGTSPLSLSRVA